MSIFNSFDCQNPNCKKPIPIPIPLPKDNGQPIICPHCSTKYGVMNISTPEGQGKNFEFVRIPEDN
jgi:hypothetical protein